MTKKLHESADWPLYQLGYSDVDRVVRAYHAELEADGWQVVPKEATQDMIDDVRAGSSMPGMELLLSGIYQGMVERAPSPLDPPHDNSQSQEHEQQKDKAHEQAD
ncbi:MAG: hypothetical protein ACR2PW_04735 [Gammaproteobacteria bacterium]